MTDEKQYRLAIVGSRTYTDYIDFCKKVDVYIEKHGKPDIIVSGGAIGTDTMAEQYAKHKNIETNIFRPQYTKYGDKAPLIRNTLIVNNCDRLIAFFTVESKGTYDTWNKAQRKEIVCERYDV
jgi:hypothetical protein